MCCGADMLPGTQGSFRMLTTLSQRPFEFSLKQTPGTHTTPPLFFEEEEAVNMPYSADTMDGGVPGYGCVDGGQY